MIAYIDSSVLLRIVLGQPNRLAEWPRVTRGVSSALLVTECLRTLDRLRVRAELSAQAIASRREAVHRLAAEIDLMAVDELVLGRAAQPLPVPLGTLDAIHLASALAFRESEIPDLVLTTHDQALGLAGRASGLTVIGC